MNKRILPYKLLLMMMVSGLTLTSCTEKTDVSVKPAASTMQSTGFLTDYGDPGINLLATRLQNSSSQLTHVVVIGDSHTAADFLSGELRQRFQSRFGNGGVGFISPLAVPGNRYGNVKFREMSGWKLENSRRQKNPAFTLGGNIATPVKEQSSVSLTVREGEPRLKAQVLYRTFGNATLKLQDRPVALANSQGRWTLSESALVPGSFSVSLSEANETQLAGIWLTSARQKGVIVSALGINGAQISMLDKWQNDWPGTLSLLHPDLVILAYGTNEAFNTDLSLDEYRQTLVRQISKIRQAKPDTAILLVGPGSSIMRKGASGCEQRQSPLLKPIIRIQKEVAESEHTLFWDWFAWMGGDCAIERLAAEGKARPDLIHLSAEGYQQSAAALWQDLQNKLARQASEPGNY